MSTENNLLKKGQFHYVYDKSDREVVIEDKTKRGLPVLEQSLDGTSGLVADKGRLYDANGRGHIVPYDGTSQRINILWSKFTNLEKH